MHEGFQMTAESHGSEFSSYLLANVGRNVGNLNLGYTWLRACLRYIQCSVKGQVTMMVTTPSRN